MEALRSISISACACYLKLETDQLLLWEISATSVIELFAKVSSRSLLESIPNPKLIEGLDVILMVERLIDEVSKVLLGRASLPKSASWTTKRFQRSAHSPDSPLARVQP